MSVQSFYPSRSKSMGCEPVMASEKWRFVWQICEEARQLPAAERIAYVQAKASNPDIAGDALSLLVEPEDRFSPPGIEPMIPIPRVRLDAAAA
jgi:hypothetical protein